jgi:hypothetical protein
LGIVDKTTLYTKNTMHSKVVSSRGNKCCKIYVTNFGWSRSFPMQKESEAHETLDLFLGRYGIPESLICDGANSYTGGQYRNKTKQEGIFCKLTDSYSPWQNRTESEITEVKLLASKWTVKSQSPRKVMGSRDQISINCLLPPWDRSI